MTAPASGAVSTNALRPSGWRGSSRERSARTPHDRNCRRPAGLAQELARTSTRFHQAATIPRPKPSRLARTAIPLLSTTLLVPPGIGLVSPPVAQRDPAQARRRRRQLISPGLRSSPSLSRPRPDSADQYLSDGLTEDPIDTMGQAPELRVVARTSAFAFKDKDQDVREVGARLNVGAMVEAASEAGRHASVTAQLVDITDGYQR